MAFSELSLVGCAWCLVQVNVDPDTATSMQFAEVAVRNGFVRKVRSSSSSSSSTQATGACMGPNFKAALLQDQCDNAITASANSMCAPGGVCMASWLVATK
jgi:hypothetical protein